jgi:acetoin utilization deacetylase AcuC-like enzyme
MLTYYSPLHTLHDPGVLPQPEGGSHNYYSEVAARGLVLRDAVQAANFGPILPPEDFGMAPLEAVHTPALLALLQSAYARVAREEHGGHHLPRVVLPETFAVGRRDALPPRSVRAQLGFHCYDTSSPLFARTWDAVYAAAQVALSAAQAVARGERSDRVVYALCRPPGHHAGPDLFGGFCYVNNAAVAAQWLAGQGARVALLDVDYHHGNGTQELFYARADVLTASIHADPHDEYPYFWGLAEESGAQDGAGANLNLPLPRGTDEAAYLAALDRALAAVRGFGADALVLSLGLDTYKDDPVGGFLLETASYARMGARVARLALPTVVVQEGGYYLPKLGENVVAFFEGLIG